MTTHAPTPSSPSVARLHVDVKRVGRQWWSLLGRAAPRQSQRSAEAAKPARSRSCVANVFAGGFAT